MLRQIEKKNNKKTLNFFVLLILNKLYNKVITIPQVVFKFDMNVA